MAAKPTSIDEYFAALTAEQRAILEMLRQAIHAAAPGAEEGFSYGIPMFKLDGKPFIWCAAWKSHYSLYPIGAAELRRHAGGDETYETAKGTVRFPASRPLPYDLIRKLIEARVAELQKSGK